jgi:hypothetical protein
MEDASGDGAELAIVRVHAEAEKIVFGDVHARRSVDQNLYGSLKSELRFASVKVPVAILLDNSVSRCRLQPSSRLDVDDLGLERLPGAVAVLVVSADLADL